MIPVDAQPSVAVKVRKLEFYFRDVRPDAPSAFTAQGFMLDPVEDVVTFAPDLGSVIITIKKTGEVIAVRPEWVWNSDVVVDVIKRRKT